MSWKILKESEAIEINGTVYELGDRMAAITRDGDYYCGKVTEIGEDTICITDRTDTKIYLSRNRIVDTAYIPF